MSRLAGKRIYSKQICSAICSFIRAARGAANINQTELAKLVGCSKVTIARLEQGIVPMHMTLCSSVIYALNQYGISSDEINKFMLGVTDKIETLNIVIDFNKIKLSKGQA